MCAVSFQFIPKINVITSTNTLFSTSLSIRMLSLRKTREHVKNVAKVLFVCFFSSFVLEEVIGHVIMNKE